MITYYMNENTEWEPIVVHNDKPSEYQDLIDDYLAGGGLIHYIEEGVRSTEDEIPTWDDKLDFEIEAKEREERVGGLFDKIDHLRDLPLEEELFDDPEKF